MNPRQRRGVITLVIAAIGAIAVFLGVVSYVGSVSAEVGPKTTVYAAIEDIRIHQTIDPGTHLETQEVPDKYVTPQMVTHLDQLAGQKARTAITAGSYIQSDMLAPVSSLEDGQREISVNFEGDAGINGRVNPGDLVDVVAAFAKDRENDQDASYRRADIPYNVAGVLVRNAEVVAVGQPDQQLAPDAGQAAAQGALVETVPVTFAVSVNDASKLAYAEAFAVSLRITRSGNNETGSTITDDDLSFEDPDLAPALGSADGGGN